MLGRHIHMRHSAAAGPVRGSARPAARRSPTAGWSRRSSTCCELQAVPAPSRSGRWPTGTQKRVELGRALCMQPALLLLDEPMAGMNAEEKEDDGPLHPRRQRTGRRHRRAHRARHGRVMDISDRVSVLWTSAGCIADGTPDEVRAVPPSSRPTCGEDAGMTATFPTDSLAAGRDRATRRRRDAGEALRHLAAADLELVRRPGARLRPRPGLPRGRARRRRGGARRQPAGMAHRRAGRPDAWAPPWSASIPTSIGEEIRHILDPAGSGSWWPRTRSRWTSCCVCVRRDRPREEGHRED